MKPLELSEDQRIKLLEMTKSLFTEYEHIIISNIQLDIGSYDSEVNKTRWSPFIFYSKLIKPPFDDGKFIHWFEFCMTHLLNSLAFMSSKTDIVMDVEFEEFITDAFVAIFFDFKHPVDYLYERYLTIKK
jgi:hypothetical protein